MEKVNKLEPIYILGAIILGLILGLNETIASLTSNLEEPLLVLLLFFIFLDIEINDVKRAFKNLKFISIEWIINFLWTPVLAYLLASIFLKNEYLQLAFILLLVMPCTDWYLIFTNITGGNTSLSSAILPINLTSQLVLLPIYLGIFFGINRGVTFDIAFDVLDEILFPIILAIVVKFILHRFKKLKPIEIKIDAISEKAEFYLVCLIAFVIFAANGMEFLSAPQNYPVFFMILVLYYCINFLLSYNVAKRNHFSKEDLISLVFTTTARNTPLSLSIATLLFPNQSIIAIALLIGALAELPSSTIESLILRKLVNTTNPQKSNV